MKRKQAEQDFREMTKHYSFGRHKYGDARYCVHCGKVLPKSERMPDYSMWLVFTYIECKNSDNTGKWDWVELLPDGDSKFQREFLTENGGWLFITLGEGRAPRGRGAWLVSWDTWAKSIEPELLKREQRSLRKKSKRSSHVGADELLDGYDLLWDKGHWLIPLGHPFWQSAYSKTLAVATALENMLG